MIATLPSYLIRFKIGPIPSTLLEVMILICFAVWFFKDKPYKQWRNRNNDKQQKINYPFRWEIILILIISFLALIPASFSSDALGISKAYFLEAILVFILIINVFKDERNYRSIFWALSLSAFSVSLWAIIQKISGQFIANPFWANPQNFRAVSFYGYPNAIGLYLGPVIIMLAAFLISLIKDVDFKKSKFPEIKIFFLGLTIITSITSIILARSEGALAAVSISTFVLFIIYGRRSRYLAISLALISIILVSFLPNTKNYILEKATLENLSGRIRQLQWQETYNMLNDGHFILGAGLNQYPIAIKPYHQEGLFFNRDHLDNFDQRLRVSAELRNKYWQPVEIYQYPHNIFLNFWSETGLLGAILFSWFIIKFLITSIIQAKKWGQASQKPEKLIALGLFGAMTVITLHGLVDVPYFKNDLAVLFWLLPALLGILIIKNNENNLAKTNRPN
ncbi:MAG: O-antigen ligase family protein [Patescibacteria group bacterium]